MRNLKAIAFFALAIIVGLAAAIYAAGWVSQRANLASTKVVVSSVDIEQGSKVNPQMLNVVLRPPTSGPC